jgi:hypothetical protein
MRAKSHQHLDDIRASVLRTRRLADKIVGIGPFSIGIDGVLAWIPVVGLIYSVGAGGFLLLQGVRARVSAGTLAKMAGLLLADSATDLVPLPIVPGAADMLFTAHKWAADALLKDMENTVYYPGAKRHAHADERFQELMARVKSGDAPRRRVVFLED